MEQQAVQIVIIVSSLILIIISVLFVLLFSFFQKKKLEYILREREQKEKFEHALAKSKIEIRETALKNVAWELHDNVGQLLSLARLELNLIKANPGSCGKEKIEEISLLIKDSLDEIRSLSKSYNSDVIEAIGLVKALKNEIDRFNKLNFLHAELKVTGEEVDLPQSETIILFRVIQEAFTNIIKHASAKNLKVQLDYQAERLAVIIQDDGRGFDMEKVSYGSGLINMQSRASLLRAEFRIASDNNGTQINIFLPYKKESDEE